MNFIILFINKMRVVAFSFFIYYVHSLGDAANLLI